MNYLRISNTGLICAEDLILIGSSTKRDQTGKIGMFGSGWKYALAWLLRNGCKPIIYSGSNMIDIDFTIKLHRDIPVEVITVDGRETSLTTQMGPKWTGWMTLREVISNAIDEGSYTINTIWLPQFSGEQNRTTIFIPLNGELSEVMLKYDNYFAFTRKESFSNSYGRIFIKSEPSPMNIYRKGIRCYDTKEMSLIDVDFSDISINEDRLCQSYSIGYRMIDLINDGIPTWLFKKILQEERASWLPYGINNEVMQNLKELIEQGEHFTTASLQKLGGMLLADPNALVIPAEWYKKLQDMGMVKSPFEFLGADAHQFIRTDSRNIAGIQYYLKRFNISLEIRTGKCEPHVFVNNGVAYVKDDSNFNDKELAAGIIKRISEKDLMALMN